MNVKHILCPTDFSNYSMAAIQYARSLARDSDATIHLLHVIMPFPFTGGYVYEESEGEKDRQHARQQLDEIQLDHERVERHLVNGVTADEIVRFANEHPVDLIVIGTHGRTGLLRLLFGSNAEEVLRKAQCPVLAVRMPNMVKSGDVAESGSNK